MHFTLNKVKVPSILEKAIIRKGPLVQFKQHRWGVRKIGCISLEVGVYYVIYGSRLYVQLKVSVKENEVPTEKNSSRASIFATKASYISN